jgi:mannose-1-phosphate guanylyltransferase / mannose-6-phosphate isomerase
VSIKLGAYHPPLSIILSSGSPCSNRSSAAPTLVVVEGVAKVHVDGVDHVFQANDSVYIPKGAVHCLANETKLPLRLVVVQSGSYLGEDDIERLDDVYGRC